VPGELLSDMIIIFGISVAVIIVFQKLRLPSLVGFVFTGMLAGPYGLGLIKLRENVDTLAELGVVALLFTIGLEFSLRNLLQIRRWVIAGGTVQVGLTTLLGALVSLLFGHPPGRSIFFGFLLALSSTAIVMKISQDRGEIESPQGRSALAILIFQDLIVVPMILLTPLLGGMALELSPALFGGLVKGVAALLLIVAGAKWFVPYLLHQAAAARNREVFLMAVVIIALSIAWLTHAAGLSLALGAFLAGLIISESEYSHQAAGHVLPFRDIFTSFFFVSIGMLLDTAFLLEHPLLICALVLAVLAVKSLTGTLAVAWQGLPLRMAVAAGLSLSQIGEFSFILAKIGAGYDLIGGETYALFLAVSAVTMALTPFIIPAAPRVGRAVSRLPLPPAWTAGRLTRQTVPKAALKDHLVIVGFGLNGRNVARASQKAGIPYLILETNPETVRREREKGEPVVYGDATSQTVLEHAGIAAARSIVIVINDAAAARRITELARRLNPRIHIIVRTRFLQEMEALYRLGADEVIPEEFETSVEIFSRVLRKYLVPRPEIERFIAETRADGYEMFRTLSPEAATCSEISICLPDTEVATFRLEAGAPAADRTIGQLALRKEHGVTVLAVRRGGELIYNPSAELTLRASDVLVVFGEPDRIALVAPLFTAGPAGGKESE